MIQGSLWVVQGIEVAASFSKIIHTSQVFQSGLQYVVHMVCACHAVHDAKCIKHYPLLAFYMDPSLTP